MDFECNDNKYYLFWGGNLVTWNAYIQDGTECYDWQVYMFHIIKIIINLTYFTLLVLEC